MRTLVSPILSATLAMPLARFWTERHAWEEREARLSIVDDAEVDGGGLRREVGGQGFVPFYFIPLAELLRPGPDIQSQCPNFSRENQVCAICAIAIGHKSGKMTSVGLRHDVCATCFPTTIDRSSQKNRYLNQ